MAKLRKMLGNINDSEIKALMKLIETQSKETLAKWAVDYVEEYCLDIYKKAYPGNIEFQKAIAAIREHLAGAKSLKEVKPQIKEVSRLAKEAEENPAAQAAARAMATACGVVQTPTNALGFTFYAAAAAVYDRAGLEEKQEVYDRMAAEEFDRMLAALTKTAVPDETNPVKINWNC